MRLKAYILIAAVFGPFTDFGQEDTTALKQIQVKEVTVEHVSADGLFQKGSHSSDLQQLTDKLLANMAGVTLIKRGNYAQEPTIRGLNNGQINMTIDGMRVFGACTDRMDPVSSYVEPNNLQSVRLSLGPNEELIGSSIGGGFDFRLRKATPGDSKMFRGRIGTGYETNANAFQMLGGFQFSRKRFAVQVNSIYREAGNYSAGGHETIAFSQYRKWNIAGNAVFVLNEHHFLRLDYIQDDGRDIGYPALTMDVSFANAKMGAISHEYRRSGKRLYHLETKVYYNFIDHAMDDTKRPAELVPMHMDMPGTSSTVGAYNYSSWKLSEKHFLKVRLMGYRNDLHAEMTMYPDSGNPMFMLTIPDAQRNSGTISISDKILAHKKFTLTAGGSFEYSSSSITTVLGRQTISSLYTGDPHKRNFLYNGFLQGVLKIGNQWTLTGGAAKAMRNATLQELYGFYLFNRVDNHDYLGNPDLNPEQSWNVNLGSTFGRKNLRIELQLFSYFFKDYIAGKVLDGFSHMTIGASGVKQYSNLSSAQLAGGELSIHWKLIKNLHFHSVNTISLGRDDSGSPLPYVPPFKTISTFEYNMKGYRIGVEYVAAAAQNRVDTEKYGERSTPAFEVFNLSAGKQFDWGNYHLLANVRLDNLFDAAYYEHLDVMKINRQGRNLILHLTFLF